jgi:hypothetical protein
MSMPAFQENQPFLHQPVHQPVHPKPMNLTVHTFLRPRFHRLTLGGLLGLLLLLLQGCQSAPPPMEPTPARAAPLKLSSARCVAPQRLEPAVVGGITRLNYMIDSTGKVNRVEVIQSAGDSEGHKKLDRLSVSYLSTCIFPASPGAVGVVHTISFEYALQ